MSELITNGGFEASTTTLTGWIPSGDVFLTTDAPHEGAQAAVMVASFGQPATLTQTDIPVVAAADYRIALSESGMVSDSFFTDFHLTGTWSTGTTFQMDMTNLDLAPQAYTYFYTVVTAPSGAATLNLSFTLSSNLFPLAIRLDDVSMVQVQ